MGALRERWRGLAPLTRRLVAFAALNGIVLQLALMAFFLTPWKLTVLGQLEEFAAARQGQDSWGPMGRALAYVREDHRRPVYDEIFFDQQHKFQYPPTSLLALRGASIVAEGAGIPLAAVLDALSWIALAGTALCAVWLFERGLRPPAAGSSTSADRGARVAALAFLALTFYPAIKAYTQGQIQAWINALFAASLVCWIARRERSAGVLLGLACLIKPQYALFGLWGLLRRRWGFVAAFGVTVGAGLAASLAAYGLADHLNYLDALRFIAERGESYYPNQSVNGLLHRLLFNGYNLGWKGRQFPPFHPLIYALTAATSATLLLAGLLWRSSAPERGAASDLCVIALTSTLASPVAWEHHYGILLPIYAWLVPRLLPDPAGPRLPPWLPASYVLCSNFFAISTALAPLPVLNLGQSYLFFGALAVWLALLAVRAGGRLECWPRRSS